MDAAAQERCQQLMTDALAFFSVQFAIAANGVIVQQVEEEMAAAGDEGDKMQLLEAPDASEPLKTGTMTKKGGFISNWKERHFIAYNRADNWRIDYLDKEGGKVKGTVAPCGYRAMEYDEDDNKNEKVIEGKEWGVKLKPYASDRRTWYFKCTSKELQKEWIDIFSTSCWYADPEKHKNPIVADAFVEAYWATRWNFGLWGSYSAYGTEGERLGDLIMSVIDREVIYPIFATLSVPAMARNAAEAAIRNPVAIAVKSAVGGAWFPAAEGIDKGCVALKKTVADNIKPIIEQKLKLKEQIISAINGVVQPVIADKGSSVLGPFLAKSAGPVAKAFAKFATDFHAYVSPKLADGSFAEDKFDRSMRDVEWHMYWTTSPSFDIMDKMCYNGVADLMSLVPGVSMSDVYWKFRDAVNKIHYNANFTFSHLVKESKDFSAGNVAAIFKTTMEQLVHDCKLRAQQFVVEFLRTLLDVPVQELMLKPAATLVEPMQAAVDAIPVLNTFLNLTELTTDVIESVIEESCNSLLSKFLSSMDGEFASVPK